MSRLGLPRPAHRAVLRRRAQGVGFLLVVFALVGLSVAKYSGAFAGGVPVTLRTDRTGLQLDERAEVKVRGVLVGEVVEVTATGQAATVRLLLDEDTAGSIPDNVHARLLPTTLFGQRYVSLVLPEHPSGRPLAAGDVIGQDRSRAARELEAALHGLLPLLQAVPPDRLAGTLGAISTALEGRGERLGELLVRQQRLVSGLNTALPELQEDITRVADLSQAYAQAAPDLTAALADLTVPSRTLAEQRRHLAALFDSVARASGDAEGFVTANRANLIALAADSRPTLESLARYAPQYPCLLGQLAGLVPRVDQAMGVGTGEPGLHVLLEISPGRGKYLPGVDEPRYADDRGPRCYPVVEGQRFPQYPPGGPLRDGSSPPDGAAPPGGLLLAPLLPGGGVPVR